MGTEEGHKVDLLESFCPNEDEIEKWMCSAFEMVSFLSSVIIYTLLYIIVSFRNLLDALGSYRNSLLALAQV